MVCLFLVTINLHILCKFMDRNIKGDLKDQKFFDKFGKTCIITSDECLGAPLTQAFVF